MKILGIESSCDETAASVVEDGYRLLSNMVRSQIDIHKVYGGVVPEVAARSHIEVIVPIIEEALEQAGCTWDDIDGIAVTYAPGLIGSLLVGTLAARTLALTKHIPLYPVHHVEGHVYANFITESNEVANSLWNIEDSKSQKSPIATSHIPIATILDPFCGTGVVLQEALLMGYDVYGTDLSQKMIDYTKANLEWLQKSSKVRKFESKDKGRIRLETADAKDHIWRQPLTAIATETYLGQPLGGQSPNKEKFAEIVHETNAVIRDFLQNIAPQLAEGTRLCVAVPVWFLHDAVTHLPVTEELAMLGFRRHTFAHALTPLMYHRDNQVTGRELLVLTKNHHKPTNPLL